jgi:hypothetical protein
MQGGVAGCRSTTTALAAATCLEIAMVAGDATAPSTHISMDRMMHASSEQAARLRKLPLELADLGRF